MIDVDGNPIPEPEVRARPAKADEICKQAMSFGKHAKKHGFEVVATYARGPRMDNHWRVVEISGSLVIRARHEDGRRLVAAWVEKTGVRGKKEGVVDWDFEFIYALGIGRCTINPAKAYCKNPVSTP